MLQSASGELFNNPLFINILSKLIQNPHPGSINLDRFYCTILYNESKHNILALVGKANKYKLADSIFVSLGF